MNYSETVYMVETVTREREYLFGIGYFKPPWEPKQAEALLRKLNRIRSEINSHIPRSVLCKLSTIRSYAASNFQDVLSSKRVELRHYWHVPFTMSESAIRNLLKIAAPVLRGGQLGLAWAGIPEVTYNIYTRLHVLSLRIIVSVL